MANGAEIRIPVESLSGTRRKAVSIAVVGTPNSGKSTLFNRLTGLRQRTANYPGVTVERHVGTLRGSGGAIELVDLPGTHGLTPHSMEEAVAVDAVFGLLEGCEPPAGLLAIVDASNLYQGLYLLQQLLELGLPVVVALTMTDAAAAAGAAVDAERLSERLGGVPVISTVATTGKGVAPLVEQLAALAERPPAASVPGIWPELEAVTEPLAGETGIAPALFSRALIAPDSAPAAAALALVDDDKRSALARAREALFADVPAQAAEARARYAWARDARAAVLRQQAASKTLLDRTAAFLNRPWPGTIGLFLVMLAVFQAVFAWATPFMDLIDAGSASLAAASYAALGGGVLASLVADGVIAGVGSVIIFLPQILILFLFIIVLEDSGYLARAAYLMDRVMRSVGLSGQSIIPMISSFACAVPGIMATRVIPQRRDRIATILAAPFMTCSARLPVYALLIAAFVPRQSVGPMNLQGLVLFGLYAFGIVMGIVTALLIRRTALRGPRPAFALMLPEFRRPNLRTVAFALLGRVKVFLYRAGTGNFRRRRADLGPGVLSAAGRCRCTRRRVRQRAPRRTRCRRASGGYGRFSESAGGRAARTERSGADGAFRRAGVRAPGLGLARLGGCHRRFPRPGKSSLPCLAPSTPSVPRRKRRRWPIGCVHRRGRTGVRSSRCRWSSGS